jgi:hypothetical protein
MILLLCFVLAVLAAPIKSKMRLDAENAVLRHQLTVLRRRVQGRVRLTNKDRRLLIVLYRWFPSILRVLTIIRPKTLIYWHRAGFCCYWRWKSRSLGGRPPIEARLRALIRQMNMNNPLWVAPPIQRRTAQAWVRGRAFERRQIHGQATRAAGPGMAHPPAQSCSRYRRHGLLGSIRRECLGHIVVFGEAHLRRILRCDARYYNDVRTHRSLDKDAPVSRSGQRTGSIKSFPILGGLHHHYARV